MLSEFGASSKLNAEWEFVTMLKAEGRRSAGEFLDQNAGDVGRRSTSDVNVLVAEC
jgi:NTE family protein